MAANAGVTVVGGHSIDDAEPKFGLAVTGVAHPDAVVRNSTATAGDVLFLTKPIGGGVITTAAKRENAAPEVIERCTEVMTTLNGSAAEAAISVGPSAMTDVTGFGLLGHLRELTEASGVAAHVEAASIPVIEGVLELVELGDGASGGARRNREYLEPYTIAHAGVSKERLAVAFDPMTSGGLLVATPAERADEMERALAEAAPATARIGRLVKGEAGRMELF
jgi:selenide,water dikinase